MICIIKLILLILSTLIRVNKPGGTRALTAENIILKQQLLLIRRKQQRAPKLTVYERILFGFLTGFIGLKRLSKVAVIISPVMLLKYHRALVKRKYQLLFGGKAPKKPGPRGPSQECVTLF